MVYTYYYPKFTGGYRWNFLKRCLWHVGIEPTGVADIGEETIVQFDRELTVQEKAGVDAIVADNPQFAPSTGVSAQIRDLWEEWDAFKTRCGLPDLCIFFQEAVTGSGKVDRILLWHPTPLTTQQKNTVKTNYNNLWIG